MDYSKYDADGVQVHDEFGSELPDPTPMSPPLGYIKQPSMFEIIRAQVQQQLSAIALAEGQESFEDSEDFDVGDDFDPMSPHEQAWDLSAAEITEALRMAQARKALAEAPPPDVPAAAAPVEPPPPSPAAPPKAP